jgi:hypothetical protein
MVEEISGRSRLPVVRKLHRSSEITRNSESQKLATNRRCDSQGLDAAWADAADSTDGHLHIVLLLFHL